MAATMMTNPPSGTQALAVSGQRKPDLDNCRKSSSSSSSSSNWWSPLFGVSAEPDYIIDSVHEKIDLSVQSGGRKTDVNQDLKIVQRSRLVPGLLTEEKAKQLRKMTREAEAFHDVMYHSAVASRLALDFSDRTSGR